ncbi:hypothetical protein CATRI_00505 [Corynebacterium atrinae]|uniref:DUF6941 family protein n=1 Tax=Corynebacterium atrinae TaxID=1336740 RepID=UPI0025B54625|nr:hypothetical protein [Corynebacterium atrinae]WJY62223.1 hypothetical protein CATRI_00505 [Corynebacterium atrinae]
MAADLDYAYLAEFARTQDGTITSVGASFTQTRSSGFPAMMELYVVGRIRRPEDEAAPTVSIEVRGPGESPAIEFAATLEDTEDAVKYDGKIGTVFVFSGPLILSAPGIYECRISVDGEYVRRLAFEALTPQDH